MPTSRREMRLKKKASGRWNAYRYIAFGLIAAGLAVTAYAAIEWYKVFQRQSQLREEFEEATAGFGRLVEPDQAVIIDEWEPMILSMPSIGVQLAVVSDFEVYDSEVVGDEPWNFSNRDYQHWIDSLGVLLDEGPVFYQLSDLPSTEGGNMVIAGHRAAHWNFFLDLDLLEPGDEIFVDVSGYRFIYHVTEVVEISKYDWTMFYSTEEPSITLQTCTPKHVPNPPLRLNARGVLHEVVPLPAETPFVN